MLGERQLRDQRRSSAGRAVERHCPAERLDSVPQPCKTRAASWVCPADAVVSDTDPEAAVAQFGGHVDARGLGVLRGVRQRLRDEVIGGNLDRSSHTSFESYIEHHRDRRTSRKRPQRRREAAAGQGGRVKPGSDRAQFFEHPIQVDLKASKLRVETSSLRSLRLGKHPSLKSEHDDPLLRPIVEVALNTPTRLVGGSHDAHARGFQLRPRLHVRERACDQSSEVRQTRLRLRR